MASIFGDRQMCSLTTSTVHQVLLEISSEALSSSYIIRTFYSHLALLLLIQSYLRIEKD